MEPWQSWAVALTGGGLAYWYYASMNQSAPSATRGRAQSITEPAQTQNKATKKDTKRRRTLESAKSESSSIEAAVASVPDVKQESKDAQTKKRKGGKKDKSTVGPAATPVVAVEQEDAEETLSLIHISEPTRPY